MIILSMSLVSCSGCESSKNSVYTNDTTSSIKTSDTGGSDSNSIIMNGYIYSMVMVVDLVPIQEDIDDIYNIKVKLILYPKYLFKS